MSPNGTYAAAAGIQLDREPSGKYPRGKHGAHKMVRHGIRQALADPRRRDEV